MSETINHLINPEGIFDGISDKLGTVIGFNLIENESRITIRFPEPINNLSTGEDILVNGVRAKVSVSDKDSLSITIDNQSHRNGTLSELKAGDSVNIQRARRADEPIRAQLVTGEIDGVGKIVSRTSDDKFGHLRISFPTQIKPYLFPGGYVCVDGICLTVKDYDSETFLVSLLPKTMSKTTLGTKGIGDKVNIEANVVVKILEKSISSIGCKGHEKNILNWIVSPY